MSSTAKSDEKIPTIGGFFLSKRQMFRATTILLALVLSIMLANNTSLDTVKSMKGNKWNLHLFSFACFFGCGIWVTFVAGLVMFNNLPRHVFGKLQSKLFPKYFQFSILWVGVCLLMEFLVLLERYFYNGDDIDQFSKFLLPNPQLYNLVAIIVTLIWNLKLEPITTKVMFKRHTVERKMGTGQEVGVVKPAKAIIDAADPNDVEELKTLSKMFGKLHGISASLNLLAMILGTWHVSWLGSKVTLE